MVRYMAQQMHLDMLPKSLWIGVRVAAVLARVEICSVRMAAWSDVTVRQSTFVTVLGKVKYANKVIAVLSSP